MTTVNNSVRDFSNSTELTIYQDFVADTSSEKVKGTGQLEILWAVAGMLAEAGEVSGVCEKALRKNGVILPEDEDKLFDELGDTLYFLSATCNALDITLDEVIEYNISKVSNRVAEGYYSSGKTTE